MRSTAFLLLWALAAPAQTGEPKQLSRIEGRVVNTVTGAPVGKAAVTLAYVRYRKWQVPPAGEA